jgi:tRNA A37 threonylcarbamoyladenosine biosynthesis protein TsaE
MSFIDSYKMRRKEKNDAISSLKILLECAGCKVEWEELETQLRRMNLRAILNLKYRVERARQEAAEEATNQEHDRWVTEHL